MVAGVAVNVHAFHVKQMGQSCDHNDRAMRAASALYSSYVVLFVNFFLRAYILKGQKWPANMESYKNPIRRNNIYGHGLNLVFVNNLCIALSMNVLAHNDIHIKSSEINKKQFLHRITWE